MPDLDVTDIINDPDFAEQFTVVRTIRAVSSGGLAVDTSGNFYVSGIILPTPGARLMLFPESERSSGMIDVYTQFRLVPLTDQTAADQIVWHNKVYRVRTCEDWTDWGQGFTHATCELTNMTTDQMP